MHGPTRVFWANLTPLSLKRPAPPPSPPPSGHWVQHAKIFNDTCGNVGTDTATTAAACQAKCVANPRCTDVNFQAPAGPGCILCGCAPRLQQHPNWAGPAGWVSYSYVGGELPGRTRPGQVWFKELEGGERAIACYNSGETAVDITAAFGDVGFAPTSTVRLRDLYKHADLGEFTGSWTAAGVPPHGVRMLRALPSYMDAAGGAARGALPALKSDDWGEPLWPDVCTQRDVKSLPFCDMRLSVRARAADVVSRLTVDEKQLLIVDGAMGVASLHLPGYRWWSEALHGVEGTFNGDQCPANGSCPTSFPAPSAMGASFNDTLAKLFGGVVGREARALRHEPGERRRLQGGPGNIGSGLTEWAPTVNMQRDPRCQYCPPSTRPVCCPPKQNIFCHNSLRVSLAQGGAIKRCPPKTRSTPLATPRMSCRACRATTASM